MGSDHSHDHDNPHAIGTDEDLQAKARALQSVLIDQGLVSTDAIDQVITAYEEDVGPMNGAKVVAKAWVDPDFKSRLLTEATPAIEEVFDFEIGLQHIEVVENTSKVHNIVVCSLCSCYPWSILGLPPTWYKSPAYRSRVVREPREVLEEFGVEISPEIEVRVQDANSELRYLVLPQRPSETENLSEDELQELVTRDSMIGVERLCQ